MSSRENTVSVPTVNKQNLASKRKSKRQKPVNQTHFEDPFQCNPGTITLRSNMLAFQQQQSRKPAGNGGNNGKKFDKKKSNPFQKNPSQNFGKVHNQSTASSSSASGSAEPAIIPNAKASPAAASQAVSSTLADNELQLDQVIGSFDGNLSQFQQVQHPIRQLPKFLVYQSPTLNADDFLNIDDWDRENQNKMLSMEQSTSDLSSLYEEFQKLREHEREVMEKKGLVDNENIRRSLEDAIIFKGSCHDMCPVYERIRRSVENDVRKYEKDESGRISKSRAVKAFSRPAAGQPPPLPSDVRPPQILVQTLDYLVHNILDELPDAQSFLWDRTRSIRQDFTYQNYLGPEAMECTERIVRIHILTLHIMAKTNTEYSQQQELEQMNKALKTLSEMYAEYRSRGIKSPNEAEFRSYYLLSQLRDPELEREIQTLSIDILQDERVQLALQLRNLTSMNIIERGFKPSENVLNFYQNFFQLLNEGKVPVLMSYLLEIHLNEIRFYALKSIKKAIHTKSKPYPLAFVQHLLSFNDEHDAIEFFNYYGLPIETVDGIKCVSITGLTHNSHLIPDQKPLRQFYSNKLDFKVQSFQQLINHGASIVGSVKFASNQQSRPSSLGNQTIAPEFVRQQPSYFGQPSAAFGQPASSFGQISSSSSVFSQSTAAVSRESAFGNRPTFNNTSSVSSFPFGLPRASTTDSGNKENKIEDLDQESAEQEEELKRMGQQEEEFKLKKLQEEEEELKRKQEIERRKRLEEEQKQKLLEKRRQKEEQNKNLMLGLSKEIGDGIIKRIVKDQVHQLLGPLVQAKIAKKEQKSKLLNDFSQGLYEAFVNEVIYVEKLEIMSELFRKRQLKKKLVHKVSQIGLKLQNEQDLKKRKREEFIQASKTWGIPAVQRKRPKVATSDTSLSFIKVPKIPAKPQVDISPFKLELLIDQLSRSSFPVYNILIYVEDSIVSKLLNKKFQLSNNSRLINISIDKKLKIAKINKIDSSFFQDVNLLVFNLIDNFKQLQNLKELIKGIELNSNFKFEIIVIYWDLNNLNLESNVPKITNENIISVKFIKISSALKFDEIQSQLNRVGNVQLSKRGEINYKYKNPKMNIDPLKVDYTEQFKVNDKIIKRFKPHIEASPKFKKLPKLLSNEPPPTKKITVYSTPRPKSSDRVQTPSYYDSSSISSLSNITFEKNKSDDFLKRPVSQQILKPQFSPIASASLSESEPPDNQALGTIPKSILELRNLAKKVKERHSTKK